jgi:threonine/homoserine/homoserine lactone efflux protein
MTDPSVITIPLEQLLQLLAASIIVKLTPGPGVTATVARAMAPGLRPARAVVGGVALADVSLVLLVLVGLAAVASQFEGVMTVVRYLAAAYFIY